MTRRVSNSIAPEAAYRPGSPGVVLSPNVAIADRDSTTLAGAEVRIVDLPGDDDDVLSANPGSTGILVSYDPASHILTLSGAHTLDEYRQVLDTVTYSSTDADPSNGGATTIRTIEWQLDDGGAGNNLSAVQTTTLHFTPSLDLDGSAAGDGFPTAYTENSAGVPIADSDAVVTNTGGADLNFATVTLTNAKPEDILSISGPLPSGITGSVDTSSVPGQIIVSLGGSASPASYRAALRQVVFASTGEDTTTRDITVVVGDSTETSNTAHATIAFTAVNDTPVNVVPGSIAVTEDTASALTGIVFTDADAGAGIVTATLSVPSGSLAAASSGGVAVGGSSSNMTLTGTISAINAFIAGSQVTFTTASNATADVTLTVAFNDGGNSGTGGAKSDSDTMTLAVTAVNDAPVLSNVAASATTRRTALR